MDIVQLAFTEKSKTAIEHRSIFLSSRSQCLVKHDCTLISPGTETALFNGTHIGFSDPSISWARYPVYPGYAAVGAVIEANVDCDLAVGDQVLYYGQHASHGVLDSSEMLWARLPADTDLRPFLLGRFAQIAYSALAALHVIPRKVVVYGAGLVGNLCAQLMKTIPSVEQISILDYSDRRLAIARECGIPGAKTAADLSYSADTIVEATGSPAVVNDALTYIENRGQLILLGSSRGTAEVNFYKLVHRKLVTIIGAHETILPPKKAVDGLFQPFVEWHSQQDALDGLLHMVKDGTLVTRNFIQTVVLPGQVQTAFENLIDKPNDYLGVLIDWR
ncbi:MAG: hypothetical protein A3J97_16270 [Spirochaetes bacterium RIFOXYC1_FULL_54_7]|nr:MAG: hypothetical protein A3J97_16270 [Spirochaetes bacterium RIFOXYC1_FULL_54_7]